MNRIKCKDGCGREIDPERPDFANITKNLDGSIKEAICKHCIPNHRAKMKKNALKNVTSICEECGKVYPPLKKYQKYCGPACRYEMDKKRKLSGQYRRRKHVKTYEPVEEYAEIS